MLIMELFSEGFFVVKEEANSTCELIADFILEAKLKINNIVADALFSRNCY